MNLKIDFSVLLRDDYPKWIIDGVVTMLQLTAYSWLLAMAIGIVLAVIRMSNNRWAEYAVAGYVEYHQNVPMLVQIFIWYFAVPTLFPEPVQQWFNAQRSDFLFAAIAVGLCMAAYVSEDLRSGIRAIPRAQMEAARALGLSYLKACRIVIIPQALRIAIPPLVNHTVLLFKNTSLAMAIGVAELTYATREIESQSFRTVEAYLLATTVYLGISLLIMACGAVLETKFRIKGR
ncbi:amino acid ABC transporter permease [Noviherbaspirillum saxi]|uniref:Amino acid ABC transporter permease n=1 Tax=Noviherbaspirillum saxi TaxID=2320863 RepID=A0A3A3FK44_9BURK|nr:amino acid ABC transporter permease [Noviherbaspirillum saxi]RJF95564.1 amino acid ABC transporter permease [Noviherbaspirillum saxi]